MISERFRILYQSTIGRGHRNFFGALLMGLVVGFSVLQTGYALNNATQEGIALAKALQHGGYSIYFRHTATDWGQSDKVLQRDDWLSCDPARMRQLSSDGSETAAAIGQAFRTLKIPVGKILASPYCRTRQTAELMQLGEVQPSTDIMNLRSADYFGGRAKVIANAQVQLATRPREGFNNLLVAHGNVAQAATPIYPDEGEAVIFKADGSGGFFFVGRIKPSDWPEIIRTMLSAQSN